MDKNMKRTKTLTLINWGVFAMLYLLYSLGWHGAFERPLSPEEIDTYMKRMSKLSPNRDTSFIKQVIQQDKGQAIYMVNAIKLRDKPISVEGKRMEMSSEEVLKKYSSFVISFLIRRGSYPIYVGTASGYAAETWGIEHAQDWSSGAIMRYRSLRTLLEMATNPTFQEFHDFKIAAIEKTIAYPTYARFHIGGLRVLIFFILLSVALSAQLFLSTRMDLSKS